LERNSTAVASAYPMLSPGIEPEALQLLGNIKAPDLFPEWILDAKQT